MNDCVSDDRRPLLSARVIRSNAASTLDGRLTGQILVEGLVEGD